MKPPKRLRSRTGQLHLLPVDCRPRGFSPPHRFRFQGRSGIVAPQPDRIRIVFGSKADSHRPPRHHPQPDPLPNRIASEDLSEPRGSTPLAECPLSRLPRLTPAPKNDGPAGLMDAAPLYRPPKRPAESIGFYALPPSPMRMHPSKNATLAQLLTHHCASYAPSSFSTAASERERSTQRGPTSRLSSEQETRLQTRVATSFPKSSPSMGFCFPLQGSSSCRDTLTTLAVSTNNPCQSPQAVPGRLPCAGSRSLFTFPFSKLTEGLRGRLSDNCRCDRSACRSRGPSPGLHGDF